MQPHHLRIRMPRGGVSPTVSPQRGSHSTSPQPGLPSRGSPPIHHQPNVGPSVPLNMQQRLPTPLPSAPNSRAVSPLSVASAYSSYPRQYSASIPSTSAPLLNQGESPNVCIRESVTLPRGTGSISSTGTKIAANEQVSHPTTLGIVHERQGTALRAPSQGEAQAPSTRTSTRTTHRGEAMSTRTVIPLEGGYSTVSPHQVEQADRCSSGSYARSPPSTSPSTYACIVPASQTPQSVTASARTNSPIQPRSLLGSGVINLSGASDANMPPGPLLRGRMETGLTIQPAMVAIPNINISGTPGPPRANSAIDPAHSDRQSPSRALKLELEHLIGGRERAVSPGRSRPPSLSASLHVPTGPQRQGSMTVPPRRRSTSGDSASSKVVRSMSALPLRGSEFTGDRDREYSPLYPQGSMKVAPGPAPRMVGTLNLPMRWSSAPPWAMSQSAGNYQQASSSVSETVTGETLTDTSATPDLGASCNSRSNLESDLKQEKDGRSDRLTEAMDMEWHDGIAQLKDSSLNHLLHHPDMVGRIEGIIKDTMLGTIERHTEKIVSALLAISDQRVEDIAKSAQQSEERCNQLLAAEREARQDMLTVMQRQHEELRIASTGQVEAVLQDVDSLRSLVAAEDAARAMHQFSPEMWRTTEREKNEEMAAIEALQAKIEEQKVRIDTLSKELTSEEGATNGVQAKAFFKQLVDSRINDVARTIDQLIKDFAGSLEAERAQRQESDRLIAALSRDASRYKERIDLMSLEIEALQRSQVLTTISEGQLCEEEAVKCNDTCFKEEKSRYDIFSSIQASIKQFDSKFQEIKSRISIVEENCSHLILKTHTVKDASGVRPTSPTSSSSSLSHHTDLRHQSKELEEKLEQRMQEITDKFQNEQRQVIAGLQNAIGQLERALRIRDPADSRNADSAVSPGVQGRAAPPVKRRVSPNREQR